MSSDTTTLTDSELAEMVDREIPCQGWYAMSVLHHPCDKAAVLRGYGHGCHPYVPMYKCIECWQKWYVHRSAIIQEFGGIRCGDCRVRFTSIREFCDYRPF